MDEEYEYRQRVRRYATSDLLKYCAKEAIDIYNSTENNVKVEEVPVYSKKNGMQVDIHQFHIAQWDLLEICFNSIKYSNDYRNRQIQKSDYYDLINLTKRRAEVLESASELAQEDLFKHLICIANMEFDLEKITMKNKFNRIHHIMSFINRNPKYDQSDSICYIDFSNKFYEITGFNYDTYIICYFMICVFSLALKESDIMIILDNLDFDLSVFGVSREELLDVVNFLAKEYDFYRRYDNWNILKYFPIVKTNKSSRYIICNLPALLNCFAESTYWTVRNYYCSFNSRDFTSYFGHCFEFYLNELFETYNISAEKLLEDKVDKRPDWKLETKNYIFYIEQKAALYPMETRSIISKKRITSLSNYIDLNIKKAFIQLNSYDETTDKTIIRVCLTFENIYFPETIQELVIPQIDLKGEEYLNWIISINEFEKLIFILSEDEEKFDGIINSKIELEQYKSREGRGFDALLSKERNDFISNKINYFDEYMKKYFEKNK